MPELDELVLKHVLKNAIQYGKANPGVVLGKILGENPELRPRAREVMTEVKKTITLVDSWSENQKVNKIRRIWPDAFVKKEKKLEGKLKPLKGAEKGKVVLRIAPNPNGPATMGSTRGIVINAEYAKKYDGTFIMRFDDTDPATKSPVKEAYKWYVEDAEWLGCKPDKVVIVSEHLPQYYEYAEKLIREGHCYVCFCSSEEFKKLKDRKMPCPHRDKTPEENLKDWKKMLDGTYKEGEAVLRVKTDMAHKDPAIRDWVAFRILEATHPHVGNKYRVWPMLDFEGALEDHFQGVTHIIRGKDLADSTRRQKYIYDYLGWEYPITYYWGRVAMQGFGRISTSKMSDEIKEGKYTGWDDPRLPTIRALRRRGFQPKAIREFWLDFGLTEKDIRASMKNLEAFNRRLVEEGNRYFFTPEPVRITVKNIPPTRVAVKRHPSKPKRGVKRYEFNGTSEFFVPKRDLSDFFRLKDAFNIRKVDSHTYEYAGKDLIKCPKIQWVDASNSLDLKVIMPDFSKTTGKAERYLDETKVGDVIQLERFGFVRIDSKKPYAAYYAHD
ncbi:MAG: glutamate--tRNA ligase [Candidatus Diapherotrites archaeon]|nr:glutamate--tRNA ligase [Candidatus Diapherotrites archaeon]